MTRGSKRRAAAAGAELEELALQLEGTQVKPEPGLEEA
jgi:hypothetical protein